MQISAFDSTFNVPVLVISTSPEFNYFFTLVFFFGAIGYYGGAIIRIIRGAWQK